ncbi:MAG: hypothetical protein ACREO0_05365, partial [Pseudoxanthomonas sp.]
MPKQKFLLVFLACLAACQQKAPAEPPITIVDVPANAGQSGALSGGAPAPARAAPKADVLKGTDWPAVALASGQAWISCESGPVEKEPVKTNPGATDPAEAEEGQP